MKVTYTPTIGLEIHAELKTKTKMFCNSLNDSEEKRPNVNICEVCMAEPGTLPTINKQAVKNVLKIGLALNGKIADFTEFDRKNYFYPDIPKGYQISQYKYPLVAGGELNGVALTRIHLEEDTARSTHESGDFSLVDFNRAGVPLMELVTEPVIHSAREASDFARELQMILRYLDISDADMEKGNMRVEVNISVSTSEVFGTKVEIKNLNSFKTVEKAIEYEIARQTELIEEGGKVIQETRGWNEIKQETFSQRIKENSHDYRYFPDPDLPKLFISQIPEFSETELRKEIPELPKEKRIRYKEEYSLTEEEVEFFIRNEDFDKIFTLATKADSRGLKKQIPADSNSIKLISNYIISDLSSLVKEFPKALNDKNKIATDLSAIVEAIENRKISSRGAKDILKTTIETGKSAKEIINTSGMEQISDEGELLKIISKVIEASPKVVAEYKAGKLASLQYLIGQGMKESRGKANPEILKGILISRLK